MALSVLLSWCQPFTLTIFTLVNTSTAGQVCPVGQLNTVYKLHYRSTPLHTSSTVTMPVSAYTAEERGETNTDSYKVFVKDSEGVY